MKKIFCSLTVALALLSLTGCGLKGPLYFPPADNKPAPQAGKNVSANDGVQTTPVRNDRGTGNGPTQVVY